MFNGQSFKIVNRVDADLRGYEGLALLVDVGTAVGAVVVLEPGVADVDAGLSLETPAGGERPRVAVEGTEGDGVTLTADALERRVEAERELHIAHVEVGVEGAAAHEMAGERGAQPIAGLGSHEEVAPLDAVVLGAGVALAEGEDVVAVGVVPPGIVAHVDTHSPALGNSGLETDVGSLDHVVEQVVLHSQLLCTGTEAHAHE